MSKLRVLPGVLAALLAGAAHAAPATSQASLSGFYVVVPMEARAAVAAQGIGVTLSSAALPSGLVGIPYDGFDFMKALTVTGDESYTGYGVKWSLVSGNLPAGLTLGADGRLSGTPTENGTSSFQLRATYKTKEGVQAYQVIVGSITIDIAAGTPPQAIVGQAYIYDLKPLLRVSGDATYQGTGVTWSVVSSTLPSGLSLRTDGTIGGTPTAGGTGRITARASYRNAVGEQTFEVVSLAINVALANGAPPQAIVGQAYSYDLKQHLSVTGDQAYTGNNVEWSTVSSTLPAGIQLLADGTLGGTPTAAGTGTIIARATYRGENGQQAYQVVALHITVSLAVGTPPQAIVGQAYYYDLKSLLSVTGDNAYNGSGVTWTYVSTDLPAGIVLRTDGTISGTPTASGAGSVTARATYRGVNGENTYQVVTLGINVALAAATPPQAIVGQSFTFDLKPLLTVSGDPAYNIAGVTWSVVNSTLPAGLALLNNGTISGTPTAGGTGTLTARATYRGEKGERAYQVVTLNIVVSLAAATPPQARVGESYSYDIKQHLSVAGDPAYNGSGVTWSVVSSSLPAGLQLLTNGTIAGTPSAATTGGVTARATYRNVAGQQTYNVTALPAWTYAWTPGSWSTPSACGGTTSTRTMTCVREDGTTAADASCTSAKPATTQPATDYSACTYAWSAGGWNTPSACGSTTSTRTISCVRSDGTTVADSSCSAGTKPAATQPATDYSACTYAWNAGSWSTPAACGSTTATRSVSCVRSDGTTVADASCATAKPATTQATTDYSTCTYAWGATGWSTPSACGATTATRTVYCQRSDGTTVADANCTAAKPAASQATTDYNSCSYTWNYSSWSTPSACGSVTQTRTVWCARSDGTTVADANCASTKPATSGTTTNYSSCTYSNSYGSWGSCSASCGGGTQTRTATCTRSDGTTVASSYCPTASTSQSCNTQSCYTYSWSAGSWSTPAGCGAVTATRSVSCVRSDGTTMSDAYCTGTKPATTQSSTSYSTCSYSFSYGSWGSCSASCGGGTQTRTATCVRSDGTTVANSSCGTPVTSQSCNTQSCYTYSWSYSGWSACSASCGGGTQTRTATCMRSDGTAAPGNCGASDVTSQSCNTTACAPAYTWQPTGYQCTYNSEGASLLTGTLTGQSCSTYGATVVRGQNIGTSCGPGNYIKTTYTCK